MWRAGFWCFVFVFRGGAFALLALLFDAGVFGAAFQFEAAGDGAGVIGGGHFEGVELGGKRLAAGDGRSSSRSRSRSVGVVVVWFGASMVVIRTVSDWSLGRTAPTRGQNSTSQAGWCSSKTTSVGLNSKSPK